MAHGRPRIRGLGRRFRWILATIAVHLIEILGLRVIRLQIVIAYRPCGRDAAMVAEFAKIFFPQTEQRGTVELRIAAHVVICVGVKFFAVLIKPGLFGVVMSVHVDDLGIPVRFLTRNIVATFENQDPLTGRGQVVGERSATRAGSNDLLRKRCSACCCRGEACSTSPLGGPSARDKVLRQSACRAGVR